MISGDCNTKNPLVRDGTSQMQRMLKALQTGYVNIDERDVDDLLAFIYKYSEKIQFYDNTNNPAGDWKEFIEGDASTVIALIVNKDLTEVKSCFDAYIKIVADAPTLNLKIKRTFDNIFRHIFFMVDEIDKWYNRSVLGLKLNTELKQTITSGLRDNLKTTIATYKYAQSENYVKEDNSINPCSTYGYSGDFLSATLNPVWIVPGTGTAVSWSGYLGEITEDDSLLGNETTHLKKIKFAVGKFENIIDKFIGAQARIINLAPGFLEETLTNYPSHEPHMALFLAFFQLLRIAREELNRVTKRHLDYYYKDVLQLTNKAEVPDTVHVIFELAKQVDDYLVKENTQLKAGKDSTGVEVNYQIDEDTVINKASVEKIKTVFIDRNDNYRIYSAPQANSKDGNGKEFDSDEPKWKTFGSSQKTGPGAYLPDDERIMNFSKIGFAVESPVLFLSEGARTVNVIFTVDGSLALSGFNASRFTAYLSSEKEWTKGTVDNVTVDTANKKITFEISLGSDAPPIIGFNSTKIEDIFDSDFPILKILLNNDSDNTYDYKELKDIDITTVDVKVVVTVMKNLIFQSDAGLLKSNKPFYPFTTIPGLDSAFYIGSKEIFQKDLTYLKFGIEWKDVPASKLSDYYDNYNNSSSLVSSNLDFKVQCYALIDGRWVDVGGSKNLFYSSDDAKHDQDIILGSETGGSSDFEKFTSGLIEEDITEYFASSQRGFIKMVLTNPPDAFGHKIYRDAYTKAIIAYAKEPNDTNKVLIPNEPYTPLINLLKVDYNAKDSIDLKSSDTYDTDESKFYHLCPFGIKMVRKASPSNIDFLPQFQFENAATIYESQGELFLGISNLTPPQSINVLFQMAEGSADPELPKQNVYWSYLSNDEWISFDKTEVVSDTTNELIISGIIEFSIPGEATNENSILPTGYHWIKASLDNNSAAVCDTIEIIAQAAQAVFQDSGNSPNFLANPISAGTITGLKVKDASVKKVTQPYSSLGGKTTESDEQFYIRVSERLRHKERGIAIWDYEKLILQEFPSIYKVKCINHSTYIPKASEFAPGYVSIIVIPSLLNKNAVDPLEPRASVGLLNDIKDFLKQKISPFAAETIQVLNPLYEKIKVEFNVKFFSDFNYYKKVLEQDIIEFLSPWVTGKESKIIFGGIVYKSVILNFVEERDYVDYVTDFIMSHITEGSNGNVVETYEDEITVTTARSILVSNNEHIINEEVNC